MDTTTATGVSVKEDQVSTATSTSTSTMPTLPNGWGPTKEDGMTPVILGLSLLLALLLIIVMMGIVLWRRKRRKLKGKDRDAEKTTDVPDQELSEEHKRAMSQQRMWSRASARWMNNVRQAARRRRKRVATGLVKGSDVSLLDQPSFAGCSSSVSLAHTSTTQGDASSSWRRSSRSRSRGEMRSLSRSRSSSIRLHDPEGPSRPLSHPPAYIPRPSCDRTTEHLHPSDSTTPSSSTPKASFAFAAQSSTPVPTPPSSPIPYDSIHSAHVATDDKVVLARMAELASAPPPTAASWPTAPSAGSTEIRPSVPELEEEFEVLPSELDSRLYGDRADRRASSSRTAHDRFREGEDPQPADSGLHQDCMDGEVPTYAEDALRHRTLALPAPPQKVPLNGPSFYEYPSEFEDDVANVGPSLGPSSPPFEAPSAPPCEEEDPRMMFPSAPPLEYAEGSSPSSEACIPSAPALESPTGLAPALPFPAPALNPRPCPGDHGPPGLMGMSPWLSLSPAHHGTCRNGWRQHPRLFPCLGGPPLSLQVNKSRCACSWEDYSYVSLFRRVASSVRFCRSFAPHPTSRCSPPIWTVCCSYTVT
ncbi:uncharacterized protein BXZ73DRAFT_39243 [Epithele typhae]|uniref:uncharacterized protein n=1 Tax=Epithele typhae TaxID=378194 RepID=UPI0020082843|nr:uncharacterized protein BXZ73DRAFT_39243 [Epithele typhae]KAH9944007.1 hypothetical protein BXZ73DRAFT_39243 [Epithele typhae]